MTEPRLQLVKKFYTSQIKPKHGVYHFGTSGTIYGLGYGPKFHQNKHGHSIDCYSNRKSLFFGIERRINIFFLKSHFSAILNQYLETKYKRISDDEKTQLNETEEICYKTMEMAIEHFNQNFTPLIKTISPNVANIQLHLDVFDERNKKIENYQIMY